MGVENTKTRPYYSKAQNKLQELTAEKRAENRTTISNLLSEYRLTQVWLIQKLAENGIITNKSEMSSILHGTRCGSKVDAILIISLKILNIYGRYYTNSA